MPQDEPRRSGRSDVLPADPGASGSSHEQTLAILAAETADCRAMRAMFEAERAMLGSRARLFELEREREKVPRLDTEASTVGTVPPPHASVQVDGIRAQNIYHMLPEAQWASDWPGDQYRPETFEMDGFSIEALAPTTGRPSSWQRLDASRLRSTTYIYWFCYKLPRTHQTPPGCCALRHRWEPVLE